jgi:hypothetical protein
MAISLDIKNLTFQAIKKCRFMDSFFLVTRGVRTSLCASQLIPEPTEHPASQVGR